MREVFILFGQYKKAKSNEEEKDDLSIFKLNFVP